jgi:hypothetical protein
MDVFSSLKLQAAAGKAVECTVTLFVMLNITNTTGENFVNSGWLCAVVWQPQSDWHRQSTTQHTPNSTTTQLMTTKAQSQHQGAAAGAIDLSYGPIPSTALNRGLKVALQTLLYHSMHSNLTAGTSLASLVNTLWWLESLNNSAQNTHLSLL